MKIIPPSLSFNIAKEASGLRKTKRAVILSCILWGSGQFFIGRQKLRGALFFAAQALFYGLELVTGYWFNYFAGQIPDFKLRVYGGFFTKGIWGLITLGTVPGVGGDHSTMLLINGIIAALTLLIFLGLYIWNIADAYAVGKEADRSRTAGCVAETAGSFRRKLFPYLVLAPVVVILLFVQFMPIVFSVLTAFTNYNQDHLPPANLVSWVGIQNFVKIATIPIWSKTFLSVLAWNVVWAFIASFSTFFMGLFQAILLSNDKVRFKPFFRSIYILPWAIPGMISLLMFRNLLNGQFGPLNQFLLQAGLIHSHIPFLTDPVIAKVSVILVNLWLGFPAFMVMLLGVLANQDPQLYEAAEIDGANAVQTFCRIKLPLLLNATAPLIVMNIAYNFNCFGAIYFLTGGGPSDPSYQFAGDTDILISWIYKLTLNQKMYSMAAVMNILIFIFIGAISLWNFRKTNAFKEM